MNKITIVILLITVAVAGFFGGMQYQKSQKTSQAGQGQAGQGLRQRFGANARAVRGQIVSADSGSMTVKLRDGSTKIVILSGSATITKAAPSSKSDLTNGAQVMVFGTNNSDGSVTAQAVQLNPGMGRPGGGNGGNQ